MRAIRWIQLLEPLGYKPKVINALGSVMIAYLANLALPRIGEVVRAGTLSKYEKIPVSEVLERWLLIVFWTSCPYLL